MTASTKITDHRVRKFQLTVSTPGFSNHFIRIEAEAGEARFETSLQPVRMSRAHVDELINLMEEVAKYMDGQDG